MRFLAKRSPEGRGCCRKCDFLALPIRGHGRLPGVSEWAFYAAFGATFRSSASSHRPQPPTPLPALPFLESLRPGRRVRVSNAIRVRKPGLAPPRPLPVGSGESSHRARGPSPLRPWSSWAGSAGRPCPKDTGELAGWRGGGTHPVGLGPEGGARGTFGKLLFCLAWEVPAICLPRLMGGPRVLYFLKNLCTVYSPPPPFPFLVPVLSLGPKEEGCLGIAAWCVKGWLKGAWHGLSSSPYGKVHRLGLSGCYPSLPVQPL